MTLHLKPPLSGGELRDWMDTSHKVLDFELSDHFKSLRAWLAKTFLHMYHNDFVLTVIVG